MSILEFKDFTFKYESLSSPTLKHINLAIEPGEKVLIAGPSGSGKSTLAHCINGLIPFSYKGSIEGSMTLKGMTQFKSIYEISQYVGTILQDQDCQFVGLTVGEDVAFAHENDRVAVEQMRQAVAEALEAVDMSEHIQQTPYHLSGGQKQRVSLAGILSTQAEILLFDEPLANLDPMSRKRTMEVIDKIYGETQKTIIVVEHRIEDVLEHHFDRVILINHGEVIANDTPDRILASGILADNGLREPLYVEALKRTGLELSSIEKLSEISAMNLYGARIQDWYGSHQKQLTKPELSQDKVLELKDIWFRYYKDEGDIIKGVNLELRKGEILAILGNNGAGKSTLLKLISGIKKPRQGQIFLKGSSIDTWSVKQRSEKIGYVMQNPNHMITQNMIYDEIALGLKVRGVKADLIEERVNKALKICGLSQYKKWPVSALSYGQKKRVTIASILALEPEVIILDEPTAGQDYKNYREFMNFLLTVQASGISIILITHDMHLTLEYAQRAVVLSDGEVIGNGEIYDILSDKPLMAKANLRETSLSLLAEICGIQQPASFLETYIYSEGGMHHE